MISKGWRGNLSGLTFYVKNIESFKWFSSSFRILSDVVVVHSEHISRTYSSLNGEKVIYDSSRKVKEAMAYNFIKKRLWHRCKFSKNLRTPFSIKHLGRLLLKIKFKSSRQSSHSSRDTRHNSMSHRFFKWKTFIFILSLLSFLINCFYKYRFC